MSVLGSLLQSSTPTSFSSRNFSSDSLLVSEVGLVYLAVFASVLLVTATLFCVAFAVWKYGISSKNLFDRHLSGAPNRLATPHYRYRAPRNYTSKVHQFNEVLSKIDFSKRPTRRTSLRMQASVSPTAIPEVPICTTLQKKLLDDLRDFQHVKENS